jgi:HEAT repeat protein
VRTSDAQEEMGFSSYLLAVARHSSEDLKSSLTHRDILSSTETRVIPSKPNIPSRLNRNISSIETVQIRAQIHVSDGVEKLSTLRLNRVQPAILDADDDFVPPHVTLSGDTASAATSLGEVLEAHDRILLFGESGSGKTTLLRRLVFEQARAVIEASQSASFIPFSISASELYQQLTRGEPSERDLIHLLDRLAGRLTGQPMLRAVQQAWREGNILFIVDGLDEIDASKWPIILHTLETIGVNRTILASRPFSLIADRLPSWRVVQIQPLDQSQRRTLMLKVLRTYVPSLEETLAPNPRYLESMLNANPTLNPYMGNSLLLTLASIYFALGRKPPESRAQLYRFLIERSLRSPTSSQVQEDPLLLMSRLALHMMETEVTSVSKQSIQTLLSLKSAEAVEEVLASSSLWREVSPGRWGFIHHSFQEYLCTIALTAMPEEYRHALVDRYRFSEFWQQVIQDMVIDLDYQQRQTDADKVISWLVMADAKPAKDLAGRDIEHRALELATQCQLGRSTHKPSAKAWKPIRGSWKPIWRSAIRHARFQLGDLHVAITQAIRNAFFGEPASPSVQFDRVEKQACEALGADMLKHVARSPGNAATAGLGLLASVTLLVCLAQIALAQSSEYAAVRSFFPEAVLAIVGIFLILRFAKRREAGNAARSALLETVLQKQGILLATGLPLTDIMIGRIGAYPRLRELVMSDRPKTLFLRDPEPIVQDLGKLLVDDRIEARLAAAAMIGQLGSIALPLLPAISKSLLEDSSSSVRAMAAKALGQWENGALSALPTLRQAMMQDGYYLVRVEIATTMGQIGPAAIDVMTDLRWLLRHDTFYMVRRAAAKALGEWGRVALPALPDLSDALLYDTDFSVREAALNSISLLGADVDEILPKLLRTLSHDSNPNVRAMAAQTLGIWSDEAREALPDLREALVRGEISAVRAMAAVTLGDWGDFAATALPEMLQALLDDPSPIVRSMAARALGQWGSGVVSRMPDLRRAFYDPDMIVRVAFIDAISKWGKEASSFLPDLQEALLSDKSPAVRLHAAQALGNLGVAALPILPTIRHTLSHEPDPSVRVMAVQVLGQWSILSEAPLAPLKELVALLRDPDAKIARTAQEVLQGLNASAVPILPDLIALLADRNETVARAAYHVLESLGPTVAPGLPYLDKLIFAQRIEPLCYALSIMGQIGSLAIQNPQMLKVVVPQLCSSARKRRLPVSVRVAAMKALGSLERPNHAVNVTLVQLLSDRTPEIREAAIAALGQNLLLASPEPALKKLKSMMQARRSFALALQWLRGLCDWGLIALVVLAELGSLRSGPFRHGLLLPHVTTSPLALSGLATGAGVLVALAAYLLLTAGLAQAQKRIVAKQCSIRDAGLKAFALASSERSSE